MTEIDINQMVDDIFEQDQPKKKINDLRDLEQYNSGLNKAKQNEDEDKFDILYRTPQNITIKDLTPKDYTIVKDIKGTEFETLHPKTKGYYDSRADKIFIRDEEFINKVVDPEIRHYQSPERVLIHEATHRAQRAHSNQVPLVKSEYNYFKDTDPYNTTRELKNNITLLEEQIKTRKIPALPRRIKELEKNPQELFPVFTQLFPEQVINPKNKLARKANRLWFD